MRPALLNYNEYTRWQTHLMVAKNVGHGNYGDPGGRVSPLKLPQEGTWHYLADFIDTALTLRLPSGIWPTRGPVELIDLPDDLGWAVDKYAVETLFHIPRRPLFRERDQWSGESSEGQAVSGFVIVPPIEKKPFPEGIPVVKLEPDQSPREWIITDSLPFAMTTDPMVEPEAFLSLRPALEDRITVDGETLTFRALRENERGPNGEIRLNTGLKPPNQDITLFAYTVLEVDSATTVILNAANTAATGASISPHASPGEIPAFSLYVTLTNTR